MSIIGVSFISLVTQDRPTFAKAKDFYTALGFEIVHDFHSSQVGDTGVQAHCSSSELELWLNAFADRSPYVQGAAIKLRCSTTGVTKEEAEAKVKELHSNCTHGEDIRGAEPNFVLATLDIDGVKSILGDAILQTFPGAANSPVEVYATDPLGNVIGFTKRSYPFTTSKAGIPLPDVVLPKEHGSTETSSVNNLPDSVKQEIKSGQKKRIGILTSGGDAPGMNAAVRAVVRTAIHFGCEAYGIYEGYQGLVDGGKYIKKMTFDDVRGYLAIGGTVIGTARCMDFKERAGRLKAAHNLIKNGIDGLVICGGDGSLTGADLFRAEWPSLLRELVDVGEISESQFEAHKNLYICGLVGSIDNDMATTDATIGAFSSLERICQSVDYIDATAQSHSRAFVIEVMGRHCGWLAVMAGIATGADYVFFPERPPHGEDWSAKMQEIVKRHRKNGLRKTIVIVAEGAIDRDLKPITCSMVKDVLAGLGLDTRITTLGHVQRGGTACAFDRMLATVQGYEAVKALLDLTPEIPSPMIGIVENKIVRRSLVDAVALTKSVATSIEAKDFERAISLRDTEFIEMVDNFFSITSADAGKPDVKPEDSLNIAIVNVGAPAGGMNAAVRAAAAHCFSHGHKPFAIRNGWTGLTRHEAIKELTWLEVEQWTILGGSEIGTNRELPEVDLGMIAYYFQKYKFDGLIIIGGFEAYASLHQLEEARISYPAFRIPMVCIPATISNNVPGSEYSLGTDTCLNSLVEYCDVIKQSASSTRRRAFVVEVQGGRSGFVAAYAGLITGAHLVYTPEEGIKLARLQKDIEFLKKCFKEDAGRQRAGRLVLRNEKASKTYSTQVLCDIISEEAGSVFQARSAIPGHVQQGGTPSPQDRVRATRLAIKAVTFLEEKQPSRALHFQESRDTAVVLGVRSSKLVYTPVSQLWENETEVSERRPNKIHWQSLLEIQAMLVGRTT